MPIKKLESLEKKLTGHEGETVEIKIKEDTPIGIEVETFLETKNRGYLLYFLSSVY